MLYVVQRYKKDKIYDSIWDDVPDSDGHIWGIWRRTDKFLTEDLHAVVEIQADGPELELIRAEITGIPFSNQPVQRWFGDDAKFIASTLMTRSWHV